MSYDEFRAQFASERCRHVVVGGFLDEDGATSLRAQLTAAGVTRFHEPDRGHYEINSELTITTVFDELRAIAEELVERTLVLERAAWLRMRHRDYQLIKDDARSRPIAGDHIELTLDLSATATGQAELVYTDGAASWVVPQIPGAIAIVAKETWVYRYARYLDAQVGDAVVERLRLSLGYSG